MSEIPARTRGESYEASIPEFSKREQQCMDAARSAEPRGITCWEVAAATGLMIHVVRPRMTTLAQNGHLREEGVRYWAPTDRNETVYRVVQPGQQELPLS